MRLIFKIEKNTIMLINKRIERKFIMFITFLIFTDMSNYFKQKKQLQQDNQLLPFNSFICISQSIMNFIFIKIKAYHTISFYTIFIINEYYFFVN